MFLNPEVDGVSCDPDYCCDLVVNFLKVIESTPGLVDKNNNVNNEMYQILGRGVSPVS